MNKKVLFIYAGENRKEIWRKWQAGLIPDTSLFGLNHLSKLPYLEVEIGDITEAVSLRFEKWLRTYLGFNQIFYFFLPKLYKYDYVISSVGLNLLLVKNFFGLFKTKWVIINIHLTNLLKRNGHKKIKTFLIKQALKKSEKIICLSRYQIKFLEEAGVPAGKLGLALFGVDKDYYEASDELGDYLISVGRDNGRDYLTLVKAMKEVNSRLLLICSPRNIVGLEKEIPENVEVRFDLPPEEVKKLLKGARMIITPSKKSLSPEGSDCSGQTAILESMACGKAVLATYREWMDDYFVFDEEIVVVDPEDPVLMAEKINQLLKDENKLKSLGSRARQAIEERLNSKEFALSIYQQCLKK